MRLSLCEGESLRLCASCGRNVDNTIAGRAKAQQVDTRPFLTPTTRGERCFDWYPLPPKPTTPGTGA